MSRSGERVGWFWGGLLVSVVRYGIWLFALRRSTQLSIQSIKDPLKTDPPPAAPGGAIIDFLGLVPIDVYSPLIMNLFFL